MNGRRDKPPASAVVCPACQEDLTESVALWGERALVMHPCRAQARTDQVIALQDIARHLARIADALERAHPPEEPLPTEPFSGRRRA